MNPESPPTPPHAQTTPFDAPDFAATPDESPIISKTDTSRDAMVSRPRISRPRRRWRGPVIFGVLLLSAIFGVWRVRENQRRWKWEAITMPERLARVPKAWTVSTLAQALLKNKKVRDRETFLQAARQVGLKTVAPGGYLLPSKAGPLELAQVFKAAPPLLKITIPEGWTAGQIGARLQAHAFAAGADFARQAYPPHRVSAWEGRLFPETYLLPRRAPSREIAARLQKRFDEIAVVLPRPFPIGAKEKRLNLDQVVTLASLVERETSVADERPVIAGVLLNRLRRGMRLQCDATVQYARRRETAAGRLPPNVPAHKARLLWRDLEIHSPYNTYRVKGLPPGAICNPGEAALLAAARPRPTKYFFYVWSPKLERHRFAETFEQHKRNVKLFRQERGD